MARLHSQSQQPARKSAASANGRAAFEGTELAPLVVLWNLAQQGAGYWSAPRSMDAGLHAFQVGWGLRAWGWGVRTSDQQPAARPQVV